MAGRGEFLPVDPADTPEARRKNRRTEIILSPDLSEIFRILECICLGLVFRSWESDGHDILILGFHDFLHLFGEFVGELLNPVFGSLGLIF